MGRPIAEIRRPEIVRGTISAFNKHGSSLISYDLIAEEAKMSRQLVRHYFPDPNDLILAVCDVIVSSIVDSLAPSSEQSDPQKKLTRFLDIFFDVLDDGPTVLPENEPAINALISMAASNDAIRARLLSEQSALQATFETYLSDAHPALDTNACHEVGYILSTMILGHWRMIRTMGGVRSQKIVARAAMDRIIDCYIHQPDVAVP